MRLVWSAEASRDIDDLYRFLRVKSAPAADRALSAIQTATDMLVEYPMAGRSAPLLGPDVRQLPVHFSSSGYLIRYRIIADTIQIIHVRHMRQRPIP